MMRNRTNGRGLRPATTLEMSYMGSISRKLAAAILAKNHVISMRALNTLRQMYSKVLISAWLEGFMAL